MSEQARIETAIDTTIDNCEVLRARLAKYEDADGKPITTIAEQAREIERRDDRIAELIAQCNEIYAIKSKPSGVALSQASLTAAVDAAMVEMQNISPPLGRGECARLIRAAVARLNSSPASAGDERAAGTKVSDASINCWSCKLSVSLDERADADGNCPHCRVELDLEEYLRAALSANHSEQVRDFPDQALLSDVVMHLTNWLDLHECECENGHVCGRDHVRATRDKAQKLIAAAPSAGSQGGDV